MCLNTVKLIFNNNNNPTIPSQSKLKRANSRARSLMFFLDYRLRASLISYRWKIEGSIWLDNIDRQVQNQGYCWYCKFTSYTWTASCLQQSTAKESQKIDFSSCISIILCVRLFLVCQWSRKISKAIANSAKKLKKKKLSVHT